MLLNLTQYHRPGTVEEALDLLDDQIRPLAGGTQLIASQDPLLEGVVDLANLGLDGHQLETDGRLRLGATLRLADLPGLENLSQAYSGTLLEAGRSAWPSLGKRHLATLGGQCWAVNQRSLLPALMIALDASFTLTGQAGSDSLTAQAFYQAARPTRQLLTGITLSPEPAAAGTAIETVRSLPTAIPSLGVAVHLAVDSGRLTHFRAAIGPGVDQPLLLETLGQSLDGQPVGEVAERLLQTPPNDEIHLLGDSRGTSLYRSRILPVLLGRATRRALELAGKQP